MQHKTLISLVALLATTQAFNIPTNLENLYETHKPGKCSKVLKGGFAPGEGSSDHSFTYCGDINGAVFLHTQDNGGQYADMDIDCDGANRSAGKCSNDPSGQDQTAFMDTLQSYKVGINDLDANIHPYVVLGNENFDLESVGVKPLSVVAVVCGGQLHYGIWGDTNGANTVGEASISMGDLCFPKEGLTGDNGHGAFDVMYLAFVGDQAVPGAKGANWKANSGEAFEASIKSLGDKLVAGLS